MLRGKEGHDGVGVYRRPKLGFLHFVDFEDARGGTPRPNPWLGAYGDGRYECLFNEDLIELGLARTTTFAHTYRREFERLREEAEERGAGLWALDARWTATDRRTIARRLFMVKADQAWSTTRSAHETPPYGAWTNRLVPSAVTAPLR